MACGLRVAIALREPLHHHHHHHTITLWPACMLQLIPHAACPPGRPGYPAGTPADLILSMMACLLDGRMPDLRQIVLVRTAIRENYDIYMPMGISQQLKDANMDVSEGQRLRLWLRLRLRPGWDGMGRVARGDEGGDWRERRPGLLPGSGVGVCGVQGTGGWGRGGEG